MIEITMKVGPKGQVVIPKVFRTAFKMAPGSDVIFAAEKDKLVLRRPATKATDLFEDIAKRRNKKLKMHPHEAYEEELEERLG
ncbi:MAG: AbrB/MazE/SpoVT family DNA-binding domain-containing protein [Methanomassiliicoccales archaeon]|nr:MAG: AbrB/MazE/SpoVT family DNA-binding domain-containing protein [Methanomassiliicoccales archaeon]